MLITKKSTKKSVELTAEEITALEEFVSQYQVIGDAAKKLKLPLSTLDRIRLVKRGNIKNIKKIRRALPVAA